MSQQLIIGADRAGCWLDGAAGWRNTGRVIILAIDYGFKPPDGIGPTYGMVRRYMEATEVGGGADGQLFEDVSALADAATDYLTSVAPDGYSFEWEAGELTLRKDKQE